ncbi:MAG: hypothetical protein U0163_06665 [Gemmatimonadaceae bacterium]
MGWELLTGQRPWAGESLYTVIYRQKHDPLPPVDWFRDDVPSRLQFLIEGLLPKNPDRRWSSAARLLSLMASEAELPGFKEWQVAQRRRKRQRVYDEARARGSNPIAAAYETVRFNRGETPISTPIATPDDEEPHPADLPLEVEEHRVPSPFEHDIIAGERAQVSRRRLQSVLLAVTLVGGMAALGGVIVRARKENAPLAPSATLTDKSGIEVPVLPGTASTDSARRDSVVAAGGLDPAATAKDSAATTPPVDTARKPAGVPDSSKRPASTVATTPPNVAPPARDTAKAKPGTPAKPETIVNVIPVTPPAPTVSFSADRMLVAAGGRHSCFVGDGGKLYCWGNNERGQLGDGSFEARQEPTPVVSDVTFSQVAAGIWHTCGIATTGEVYCWGSNDAGQLGDGSTAARATPAHVGSTTFRSVRTGQAHTCGLARAGTVLCWGANAYGQLGDGSRSTKTSPSAVSLPLPAGAVTAGWSHSCAITTDGTAYCWGRNSAGQLGDGTTTDRGTPAPVSTALKFVSIAAGREHTCAVTTAGETYCWGRNSYGQLGAGSAAAATATSPVAVETEATASVVVAGADHSCIRTRDGRALCWGRNVYGQVGDGTSVDRSKPVSPRGGLTFTSINATASHTCGTTTSGDAYCWGFNIDGQLGSGNSDNAVAPVKVSATSR